VQEFDIVNTETKITFDFTELKVIRNFYLGTFFNHVKTELNLIFTDLGYTFNYSGSTKTCKIIVYVTSDDSELINNIINYTKQISMSM
jgi:hypothetical protein